MIDIEDIRTVFLVSVKCCHRPHPLLADGHLFYYVCLPSPLFKPSVSRVSSPPNGGGLMIAELSKPVYQMV